MAHVSYDMQKKRKRRRERVKKGIWILLTDSREGKLVLGGSN